MLLATDYTGMRILLDPSLAYSVPLNTWPWGGPELPTGYSVCYEDYGQAVSSPLDLPRLAMSSPGVTPCWKEKGDQLVPLHEGWLVTRSDR